MKKNHSISGVNWASMKKFARFIFGKDNVITTKIVEDRLYFIYIKKEKYDRCVELAENFEEEFLVNIKAID